MGTKVTLTQHDWDTRVGGWRCDALDIPGARVVSIFHDGAQADPRSYGLAGNTLLWCNKVPPEEIVATVEFTQDLKSIDNKRLELEQKKLALEQQKADLERKWKWVTLIGVITTLMSFGGAWFLQERKFTVEARAAHAKVLPCLPIMVPPQPSAEPQPTPSRSTSVERQPIPTVPDITDCVRGLGADDYRRLCAHGSWNGANGCAPTDESGNYKAEIVKVSPPSTGYSLQFRANGNNCRCTLNQSVYAFCHPR